jgi:hypothetical protein
VGYIELRSTKSSAKITKTAFIVIVNAVAAFDVVDGKPVTIVSKAFTRDINLGTDAFEPPFFCLDSVGDLVAGWRDS